MIPMRQPSKPELNGDMHRLANPSEEVSVDELRGHIVRMHGDVSEIKRDVKSLMREHKKAKADTSTGVIGVVGIVANQVVDSLTESHVKPQGLALLVTVLAVMLFMHRRGTKEKAES